MDTGTHLFVTMIHSYALPQANDHVLCAKSRKDIITQRQHSELNYRACPTQTTVLHVTVKGPAQENSKKRMFPTY